MTRPSANLDTKMLDAGIKIIMKEGVEGLTTRNICQQANVNLGMFNYYFKSKDNYVAILFTGMHDKLLKFINIDAVKNSSSIDRLKHTLLKIGEYSRKYSKLSKAMFGDVFASYKTYKYYADKGTIPNTNILTSLIEEAKKDGYLKEEISTIDMFSLLFFYGLLPELFNEQLNDMVKILKLENGEITQKQGLNKRIDIILKELER